MQKTSGTTPADRTARQSPQDDSLPRPDTTESPALVNAAAAPLFLAFENRIDVTADAPTEVRTTAHDSRLAALPDGSVETGEGWSGLPPADPVTAATGAPLTAVSLDATALPTRDPAWSDDPTEVPDPEAAPLFAAAPSEVEIRTDAFAAASAAQVAEDREPTTQGRPPAAQDTTPEAPSARPSETEAAAAPAQPEAPQDSAGVGPVVDLDPAADGIAEDAPTGTATGIVAHADDPDTVGAISWCVDDPRFTVDPGGTVRVAEGAVFDAETEPAIQLVLTATSPDGSTSRREFTVDVADVDEFDLGAVRDVDATANRIAEDAASGTPTGLVVQAADGDATDAVTYAVDDPRFTVDPDGTVRVAEGATFEGGTEPEISLTVMARSSDGSTASETFRIEVVDTNEAPTIGVLETGGRISTQNYTSTSDGFSVTGRTVGVDGTLSNANIANVSKSADGLGVRGATAASAPADQLGFDPTRGVSEELAIDFGAPVASANVDLRRLIANENGTGSHEAGSYTVYAGGIEVGHGSFSAPDGQAGGAIAIDPGTAFDRIVFRAEAFANQGNRTSDSSDYFVHAVEFVSANGVSEAAGPGAVAATLTFQDPNPGDTVTYTIVDAAGNPVDDPNFVIVGNEVRVREGASLDRETAGAHDITVRGTDSGGLFDETTIRLHVFDANEHDVTPVTDTDQSTNALPENAAAGSAVGITLHARDADATDAVSYGVDDARFAVDADGTVRVAPGAVFDAESEPTIAVAVTGTSTDGSTSTQSFTIAVGDVDEADVTPVTDSDPSANGVVEGAGAGSTVVTMTFQGQHAGYRNSGGAYTIEADGTITNVHVAFANSHGTAQGEVYTFEAPGTVEVGTFLINNGFNQNGGYPSMTLDAEHLRFVYRFGTAEARLAKITDAPKDVALVYQDEGGARVLNGNVYHSTPALNAGNKDRVLEIKTDYTTVHRFEDWTDDDFNDMVFAVEVSATGPEPGTTVGIVAHAADADATDTVSYSIDDARFTIDAYGTVRLAEGARFDAETEPTVTVNVTAASTDGSTSTQAFRIDVTDFDEHDIGAISDADGDANAVGEHAAVGATVGIVARAEDADATDTVTYTLSDDAGGRFAIDAKTGVVTVAGALDYQTATGHSIEVTATSTDGSVSTQRYGIDVLDAADDIDFAFDFDLAALTATRSMQVGALSASGGTGPVTWSVDDDLGGFVVLDGDAGTVSLDFAFVHNVRHSFELEFSATNGDGASYVESLQVRVGHGGANTLSGDDRAGVFWADAGNDTVLAGGGDDFVLGLAGNDTLLGGAGDDSIAGGTGADVIDGGEGVDNAVYASSSAGVGVDLRAGTAAGGEAEGDVLSGIENLVGSAHDDALIGDAGANVLSGQGGNDRLRGGAGDDSLVGGDGDDTFLYAVGDGSDLVGGGAGWTDAILLEGAGALVSATDTFATGTGWTVALDSGSIQSSAGSLLFSEDAAGTITFDDGAQVAFSGIEEVRY